MRIDLAKTINLSNDETQAGLRTAGLSHLAGKHRIESARVEKPGAGDRHRAKTGVEIHRTLPKKKSSRSGVVGRNQSLYAVFVAEDQLSLLAGRQSIPQVALQHQNAGSAGPAG